MRIELANNSGGASQQGSGVLPRLRSAAEEFEAMMMKELLKPMTGQDALASSEDDDSRSAGALGEFSSEALARAISHNGGFGIARQIVGQLSRSGHASRIGNVEKDSKAESPITGSR